jgi:hypothetical protein
MVPSLRPALTLICLAICLVVSTGKAWGSGRTIASVRSIVHALTVQPPHQPAGPGRVNQPLFRLYRLVTAANQKASLGFLDGSVLDMNQRTDLVLRAPLLVSVKQGEAAALVTKGSHFQVQTATAVAAAVGTEFDVFITPAAASSTYGGQGKQTFPAGTTTVSVVTGVVVVSNRFGTVSVTPNHWTHVPPGRPPTAPTVHNARADVRWTNGLPPP